MDVLKKASVIKKYMTDIKSVLAIIAGLLTIGHIGFMQGRYHILFQMIVLYFTVKEMNSYFYRSRTEETSDGNEISGDSKD